MKLTELSDKKQTAFYLALAERVFEKYINSHRDETAAALSACSRLLTGDMISGKQLYDILDGFDTGITIFAEEAGGINDENAWNCIIDAVAFSSRKAYENEGAKYFPEAVELVDDDLIEHFLRCYNELFGNDGSDNSIYRYLISQDESRSSFWLAEITKIFCMNKDHSE